MEYSLGWKQQTLITQPKRNADFRAKSKGFVYL